MNRFPNARDAKEFLVSKIVEEAQREGIPLSEVERKMLYFSETDWTLPDMEKVSEEFDRTYDPNEYERKAARLIKNAARRARKESRDEYDRWLSAIRILSKQDHYLLVMVGAADLRPGHDQLKLLGSGLAVVVVLMCMILVSTFISDKYGIDLGRYVRSKGDLSFYVWAAMTSIAIGYSLLRLILGAQRIDRLAGELLVKLFRSSERNN